MEKCLILAPGQGKYKISLKHLVVQKLKNCSHNKRMQAFKRNTGANLKELPKAKAGIGNKSTKL